MITLAPAVRESDDLAEEIAELSAHLDAATHRFLTLIRRFDELRGWGMQGATSCAGWLSWRVGLSRGAAREHLRVAHALADLPQIAGAFAAGRVSYSKVRALTRVATPANDAALLEMALSSTASQLERICRGYRQVLASQGMGRPEDEAAQRWLRERETADGFVRFEVQLRVEEAAVLRQAIETARQRAWAVADVPAGTPARDLARVDALVAVAEDYLQGVARTGEGGPPVEIVVHVEPDAAGTLDDGTALAPATIERLSCDASVVVVTDGPGGEDATVGRRRQTITTLQRRALRLRDRGCRFPGCMSQRVDGHHVVPWSHGGATTVGNLCSLCRRHHTYVHEYGFRMVADGRGSFAFFRPDGNEVTEVSPTPIVGPDPVAALRATHAAQGLTIDTATNLSRWDGRRPDYHLIVGCLVSELAPGETPA